MDKSKEKYRAELDQMKADLARKINQKVLEYHNPKLVQCDESPNANKIYKLYDTFEITS